MKKTYKSSLLALSVLASFTSCSESESLQQANLSKDKITFHATLDNSWKPLSPASSSRAAIAAATEKGPIVVPTPFGKPLYLHSVVQETADLQQAAATTRGAMQEGTNLDNTYYNNSFGVTAISKDNDNGTITTLFTNQKASRNNKDIWEIDDKTNSRWPFDALVSFHAYAPFNDATDGMWSVTTDADNVKTNISYTAKADAITSQPDLIVATNAESRSYTSEDKAVELNFSHALTAVNFAISQDLTEIFHMGATDGSKLKRITLSGIPNEGTCELAAKEGSPKTALQNWTLATDANGKKTGSYTFNLENKNITIGESYALTSNDDKNILMMIPQDLNGTKAQLTFVLDIKGKGDQTFTFDLSNQTWLPGTSVTYKLSASAINHLENAEVKFPDSWKDTEQAKYSYPKTDFAAGESIGLYVVNSNNAIEGENLECVKQVDGSWKIGDGNTKYLKLKNYKYFAYYPYNATAPKVDAKKDNANEFFKDKITNWNPVQEQKTEDVLLSQDLQVGEGVIDNDASTLTFNMAHSMGLAVLNLKSKDVPAKRTFTTNNYTYYFPKFEGRVTTKPATTEYTDATEKMTIGVSKNFEGNIPYLASSTESRYMQIVKPVTDVAFKAAETSVDKRDSWGILEKDKNTFNVAMNSVSAKDITADAEFYNFARYYTTKNLQFDENPENIVDKFVAPVINCKYFLQCWGSKGSGIAPGRGGYAEGKWEATAAIKTIYVCCGNDIGLNNFIPVFYYNVFNGNKGGGATHITKEHGNVLHYFENEKNNVLLVAGAGGGQDSNGTPGDGGGLEGGTSRQTNGSYNWPTGGTQTSGASSSPWNAAREVSGLFGLGGVAWTGGSDYGGGGGSGWYGGGGIAWTGSGGGGSSYIDGVEDGFTIPGWKEMPAPKGGTQVGHSDTGVCIISSQFTK